MSERRLGPIKAIAAMSLNRVIGKDNKLPWHFPEELKWVKETTMGHALLMGRKTYESVGRPLPGRESVVLSRTSPGIEGVHVIRNLGELLNIGLPADKTIWVFGGEEIYRLTLPYCSDLMLTRVKTIVDDGGAFFPAFENMFEEREVIRDTPDYTIVHYVNPNPLSLEDKLAKDTLIES